MRQKGPLCTVLLESARLAFHLEKGRKYARVKIPKRFWLTVFGVVSSTVACGSGTRGSEPSSDVKLSVCGRAVPVCDVDRCAGGRCSLVEIARVPGPIARIVPYAGELYAIGSELGAIYAVPSCGGRARLVARNTAQIDAIAPGPDVVYWSSIVAPPGIQRAPSAGGASEPVLPAASGTPMPTFGALLADETALYASANGGPGLVKIAHGSSTAQTLDENAVLSSFVQDADSLYFWRNATPAELYRLTKDGAEPSLLLSTSFSGSLAVDDDFIYFGEAAVQPQNPIMRLPKDGGEVELLRTGSEIPWDLGVDDRCLYYSENVQTDGGYEVRRFGMPKGGGDATLVVSGMTSFALDEASLYFGDAAGSVFRRPK